MAHYFTNDENAKSNEKEFQVEVLGNTYKFITDDGVFSKGELDVASRLLIETVHALEMPGTLLDVGCGYGAMGLVLASTRLDDVHMIDVNLRAIDLAKRNAILNRVNNVNVYESFCYDRVGQKFSHVISNPPIRAGKKVVHQMIAESIDYLEDHGTLTIVMGKQHGAASAGKKMEEIFGHVEKIARKKGFWILQSMKQNRTVDEL